MVDDQRDDLIARIKAVFPKNPPGKWKYEFKLTNREGYEAKNIEQVLANKRWETVIDAQDIFLIFTDVDYV
jgi:hypothetical protein